MRWEWGAIVALVLAVAGGVYQFASLESKVAALGERELPSAQTVADLAERVTALERRRPPAQAVPKGTLAFFDADQYQTTCPSGWDVYREAKGRFLLAANTSPHAPDDDLSSSVPGKHGGSEEHRLKPKEMPKHRHKSVFTDHHNAALHSSYAGYAFGSQGHKDTTEAGGGMPHNNMPPYYAVLLCKKL